MESSPSSDESLKDVKYCADFSRTFAELMERFQQNMGFVEDGATKNALNSQYESMGLDMLSDVIGLIEVREAMFTKKYETSKIISEDKRIRVDTLNALQKHRIELEAQKIEMEQLLVQSREAVKFTRNNMSKYMVIEQAALTEMIDGEEFETMPTSLSHLAHKVHKMLREKQSHEALKLCTNAIAELATQAETDNTKKAQMATVHTIVAYIHKEAHNEIDGIKELEKSLDLKQQSGEKRTASVAVVYSKLAVLHRMAEYTGSNTHKSIEYSEKSLELRRQAFPEGHISIAREILFLCQLLHQKNDPKSTEQMLSLMSEAIPIFEKHKKEGLNYEYMFAKNFSITYWLNAMLHGQIEIKLQEAWLSDLEQFVREYHERHYKSLGIKHNIYDLARKRQKQEDKKIPQKQCSEMTIFQRAKEFENPVMGEVLKNLTNYLRLEEKIEAAQTVHNWAAECKNATLREKGLPIVPSLKISKYRPPANIKTIANTKTVAETIKRKVAEPSSPKRH